MTTATTAESRAERYCRLLAEYCLKLNLLNTEMIDFHNKPNRRPSETVAWLLDRGEHPIKLVEQLISSASQHLEHEITDEDLGEELALRLADLEVEYHHLLQNISVLNKLDERPNNPVTPLRMSAGLPLTKSWFFDRIDFSSRVFGGGASAQPAHASP
jgi:hypothetical protein